MSENKKTKNKNKQKYNKKLVTFIVEDNEGRARNIPVKRVKKYKREKYKIKEVVLEFWNKKTYDHFKSSENYVEYIEK